jgi:hypothetical protein
MIEAEVAGHPDDVRSVVTELITGPRERAVSNEPRSGLEGEPGSGRSGVFISYSHKDTKFVEELLAHLKPLLRTGTIQAWSDKQIQPGTPWFDEIKRALASINVALLLVTKDFLASEFIHEHELGPILKEAKRGGITILWVLVRACSYKETPLKDYQAVIPPDKPLAEMKAERDRAWVRICDEVKRVANGGGVSAA